MLMRVSLGIHKDNIEEAIKTYQLMSDQFFTHASPSLFLTQGTFIRDQWQLSSCLFPLNNERRLSRVEMGSTKR